MPHYWINNMKWTKTAVSFAATNDRQITHFVYVFWLLWPQYTIKIDAFSRFVLSLLSLFKKNIPMKNIKPFECVIKSQSGIKFGDNYL